MVWLGGIGRWGKKRAGKKERKQENEEEEEKEEVGKRAGAEGLRKGNGRRIWKGMRWVHTVQVR